MNRYILVSTTKDRIDMLLEFHSTLKFMPDWKVVIVTQEYSSSDKMQTLFPNVKFIHFENKLGMHSAKVEGLKYILSVENGNFVVCSADDDMEFTGYTNFDEPIKFLLEKKSVGLISANWCQHENALPKRIPKIKNKFLRQHVVYTGGGLIFDRKIAELIIEIPDEPYSCDNTVWSTVVYVNGYSNYRFLGSMTIHKICRKGGRNGFVRTRECSLFDSSLIVFEKAKHNPNKMNNYKVGKSKDLTEKAHLLHKQNSKL